MASLKDLRTRIASVKATQKITKAMQMVAAAKLRRAQEAAEAARPYSKRMGAVDKADEQVDRMFRFQTANSPIHKAIWDGKVPLELFMAPAPPASLPCDNVMNQSLAIIKRRREEKALLNQDKKLSSETIDEIIHPPRIAAPTPPFAQRLPSPNGSSTVGENVSLCGTSMRPSEYSPPRS